MNSMTIAKLLLAAIASLPIIFTILLLTGCNTCFASKSICMAKGKTAFQCETEANAAFCLANPKVCEEYRKKQ